MISPMSDSSLELSIVMPCLNEARTLPVCIKKAQGFLTKHKVLGEIIVADNGSTDTSVKIAQMNGAKVVAVTAKGYGAALAGGIQAATGKYIIMADADDSYNFSALQPFLTALREGTELVVGNRFKGGIRKGAMPFLNRYLGNPVLSFIGRLFFKIKLRDFHCGLRGFSRKAILSLNLQTTGMEYASEMIVRAALCSLSMAEVPTVLSPDGRDGRPHLHPWRDGWRHLRFLLIYSPRWLFLYPGLIMIFTGLLVSALLLPGPLMIADNVGLDVHTLLVGSMSLLVGVQAISFGALARCYAQKNGMLPRKSPYDKIISDIRLEHLLGLSALLILSGFASVLWSAHSWSAVDFGALEYSNVMRALIVAVTCIVSGLQLGFSGFLLGIMQIKQK